MKLNIIANPSECKEGYAHFPALRIFVPQEHHFIDELPINGTVDEILALDFLDFMLPDSQEYWVQRLCDLLKLGGEINIGCLDLYEVAYGLMSNSIGAEDANLLLHGEPQGKMYNASKTGQKFATHHLNWLIGQLEKNGLKVTRKKHYKYQAIVKAVKV